MPLYSVPILKDNYVWILSDENRNHDGSSNNCIVVDPGDDQPVIDFLTQHSLSPQALLCTHHHHDHIAGTGAPLTSIREISN